MFFKNILMCFLLITSLSVSNTYTGKASFYTNKTNRYNGHNKTANGEIFNENALYKMTTAYISYSDKLFIEYIKKRIPPH